MDIRIEQIFNEEMKGDTSFQDKDNFLSFLFGRNKYTIQEMRETWNMGIKHGIEIGLRRASLDGQIIELNHNTVNDKHKEFLEKFYQLANEYACAIQYHPHKGMVIIDRS
jgi:hypothetical protein